MLEDKYNFCHYIAAVGQFGGEVSGLATFVFFFNLLDVTSSGKLLLRLMAFRQTGSNP
jgi:hypothetical protein